MSDAFHWFGNDLEVGSSGDLALASGVTETDQRVARRLMTALGGYIWQLAYGAGLPGMVGTPANEQAIEAIARAQMALEQSVQQNPPPNVSVTANTNGSVLLTITYVDNGTGSPSVLTLPIGSPA